MKKIEAFKYFNKEYSVNEYSEMYKKLRLDIRYPANVNMGIAANVGETTIRYALSLMVAIKSKFVAQSVGSDKKNNIERVARTTKIGKPNATSVRVAKTLNVKRISFENGNCQ